MKKSLLLLLLCLSPLLAGGASLYAQRREVEQLRLMETLGLDPAGDGLMLSLASPATEEAGPLVCSGTGLTLSQALDRLRDRSLEAELFCGHLRHILLGEDYARQGLEELLAAVSRSSDLRLDLPVFVVLDGSARQAMEQSGSGEKGVSDVLNALCQVREGSAVSTAGSILRDLDRQGSSLVRTLRLQSGADAGDSSRILTEEGYAVLLDGKLREQISPEDAAAVELLTDSLCPRPLVLRDGRGSRVTLELQDGSLRLEPEWDENGALTGLDLRVKVRAAVLETEDFHSVADAGYLNALTARLEGEISRRIGNVLRLSRSLEADFLGLGRRIERQAPLRGRGLDRELGALLPDLCLHVTVQGELKHSNDIT